MAPLVAPLECPGGAPADARPPAVAANSPVSLRRASVDDARAVARLMAIAGEGIPMWLWGRAAKTGQDPLFVGTERAARPEANFSYRNAVLAQRAGQTVGMMLGYRLEARRPRTRPPGSATCRNRCDRLPNSRPGCPGASM